MIKQETLDLLGPDFFLEERRCGFLVSAQMKKIWATEIDLYLEFVRICEKYNLKYFLFWGSVLGAVRHKGFVPWDDDMDVALTREDYEIFAQVAPNELKAPYFFQTPYTDPGSYFSLPRLRNSSTTGMIHTFSHNKFNQGIWLDIEILDYCDINKIDENREKIFQSIMKCATFMRKGSPYLDEKRKAEIEIYHTDSPLTEWENIQRIASNPEYKGSDYMNVAIISAYAPAKQTWPARCFASAIDMPFEGITAKVPVGYEEMLTRTYGDYMQFPPEDKRGTWHSGNVFDTEKSYIEYIVVPQNNS